MRKLLCPLFFLAIALMARAEQVVISEIMYHPAGSKPEFVEIWNISVTPRDMARWRFTDGLTYEFPDFVTSSPQASFLKPFERIVVSAVDEATTRAAYPTIPGGVRIFGPWTGALANSGTRLTLSDKNGVTVCSVHYKDDGRWPKAADGTGHSLVLKNENRFADDYRNWRASNAPDGTPGLPDPVAPGNPLRFSEVHFAAGNSVDWIELQNTSSAPASAVGLFVASLPDGSNKVPLTGDVPAAGYASWTVDFSLDPTGSVTLYLVDSGNSVIGTAQLQRVLGRDSAQALYPVVPAMLPRWEDVRTTPEWYASVSDTRDAANAPAINTNVVINEIMCDPPSGQTDGEFIELYNRGTVSVSLAGWKLRVAVDFDFPANASIPPGGYVVVTGSSAFIQRTYPGVTVYGDWSGSLGNKGDLIRLTDSAGNLADEVDYHIGGDWPDLAGGSGTSLELINPEMDNNRGSAWRDSDETNKSQFQSFSISGIFQQLQTLGSATDYKELHLFMANDGHVVLRNIALKLGGTGSNLLANVGVISPTGSSATGWLVQGTHGQSYIDANGDFHLIADGYGDVRPNRAEIDCTALTQGQNYTISFDARWISGTPRLIAQTWDRSIGKPFLVPVPDNLGTPGAVNSRFTAAPLPQVDSVLHNPAVPKPTDAVKITARVTSASPLSAVEVLHRIDSVGNTNPWVASPMFDDGTNGDAVPGDGVYTATLTQHQVNNRIVQFYVRATADAAATGQCPRDGANRPAMWIVDNRTPGTTLRRQRFIISAYDRAALQTSTGSSATYAYKYPRLSNHYFNITFIHNESEVYYLGELHKSGSPWTRDDSSSLDRGKWKLPDDRIFRNRQKSTWDNDATGGNRHHNRMVRYLLYLCGFPASNQEEFAFTVVNGDGIIIRNDTEPTDNDLLNRAFDNGTDGQLMQVEDEWWFDDAWNRINRDADWSYKGTNNPIRYHTEYNLRTRETEYDYSALTELFKSVNTPATTEEQLSRVLDSNFVMMIAAVRGYAGDWDSQTVNRGKNCYLYRKASDGRWMYLHWDSDLAFQSISEVVVGSRAGWANYANKPFARRVLNYHLTQLVTKFTRNSARTAAWMDAEEAASSAYTIDKTLYLNWFNGREARVLQEINAAVGGASNGNAYTALFAVTTAPGTTTTAATIDLTGTAPSSALRVIVDGHPEAVVAWTTQKQWTVTGLFLNSGANTLTLHTVDELGNILGTTTYTITKTDNAPPAMRLTAHPGSWNVALDEALTLDAGTSFDPDGGVLSFAWANAPLPGVSISHPAPAVTLAIFSVPGVYDFTATGTDPDGGAAAITGEVLAFNRADFSPMNQKTLEPIWTLQNIEERDNYSASAWYSTEDKPGNLLVQVLDDSAKPAVYPSASHPLITRSLPATADFALQTDLTLDARQTGTFFTGLVVDTVESGTATRYLFGLDGGTTFSVKRSTGGPFDNVASEALPSGSGVLRVRRLGNQLLFQRRANEVWRSPILTQILPDAATMTLGGIFVATTAAENVRVAFDYLVLADPTNTATVGNSLRITEIMYNPAPPQTVEFVELQNVGLAPINLLGVKFQDGAPFNEFVFGDETLVSGEFIVLTNDLAAFRARYGAAARLAGAWSGGGLSNSGERVVLLGAEGNPIHDFTYRDVPPWPAGADGHGPSLQVLNVAGDYDDGRNWFASFESGGSPGFPGVGPDTDGDGIPDTLEALFGTDPHNASSVPRPAVGVNEAGQAMISWPTIAGGRYRIEYCDDLSLGSWQTLTTVVGAAGTSSIIDPANPKPAQRFYRVVALP